jgi:hypothetical protein
METAIPLFREYIRKAKKQVGRLEEITKLSINAALNTERRYMILDFMGEEFRRSYCRENMTLAKLQYAKEELWNLVYREREMIETSLKRKEYKREKA